MLNIDLFLERLHEMMQSNGMNAATFADAIGVQRSAISHVLSRRNKPSLDFLLKISHHFDVSLDWLANGASVEPKPALKETDSRENKVSDTVQMSYSQERTEKLQPNDSKPVKSFISREEPTQLIQVFEDGTFTVFVPKS